MFKTSKTDKNQLPDPTQKPDEQYNTEIKSNEIVSFEGANETEFVPYKNGVVCAKMNHMSYIDGTGTVVWEIDTAIVDPILKVDGNYILIETAVEIEGDFYEEDDYRVIVDIDGNYILR